MKTVQLDKFEIVNVGRQTQHTFAVTGDDWIVGDNTHFVAEGTYALPEGYTVGETVAEMPCIVDPNGMACDLDALGQTPKITSTNGTVLLKEVK